MALQTTAAIGLFAALLMFCGDMLLYFTTGAYEMDGTLMPYAGIMGKMPLWRLRLGGMLGPVAAFFYCIGFAHITLAATEAVRGLAIAATLLFSFGIIVGGAYHAQFTCLGLAGRSGDEALTKAVIHNINGLSRVSMLAIAVGSILLAGLIVLGKTIYPPWFVLLTPAPLYLLSMVWIKLPQPLRVVLFGGWNNLIFVIFFLTSLFLAL